MTEFTSLGMHCAVASCNQQDFLPFKCDCCSGTFCLSHRSYAAHSCSASGDKDFRALVCPLCKKTVRFLDSQDPNEQWDLHRRTSCNPRDYQKSKQQKKRCSAPGCREVLGLTNTQRCARCGKETCLTHRFPDSHNCNSAGSWSNRSDARNAAAAAAAARQASQASLRPPSLREKAEKKRAAARAQDNTTRATADRRRRPSAYGQPQGNGGGGGGGGGEQCQQCGAAFRDVGSLIAHVEAFHSGGQRSQQSYGDGGGGSGGGGEVCPICSAHFADVALLLSHVESAHPHGASSSMFQGVSEGAKNCSVS